MCVYLIRRRRLVCELGRWRKKGGEGRGGEREHGEEKNRSSICFHALSIESFIYTRLLR